MSRETIGIDIDDVIADHLSAFIEFSNQRYGTTLLPEHYTDEWTKLWGIDWNEAKERAVDFHTSYMADFQPITKADEVLGRLAARHKLVVVTARPSHTVDLTHQWVNQHFKGVFDETHFVPTWGEADPVSKGEVCRQIGASYLIDDLPRHCNLAVDAGVTSLLFGTYDRADSEPIHPDVVRVESWEKVGEYFGV